MDKKGLTLKIIVNLPLTVHIVKLSFFMFSQIFFDMIWRTLIQSMNTDLLNFYRQDFFDLKNLQKQVILFSTEL